MKKFYTNTDTNGAKDVILQNQFTAYLVTSIKRYRAYYISKKKKQRQREELLSFQDIKEEKSHVQITQLDKALFCVIFRKNSYMIVLSWRI